MDGDGEIRDCVSRTAGQAVRDIYKKDSGMLRDVAGMAKLWENPKNNIKVQRKIWRLCMMIRMISNLRKAVL